MLLKIDNEYISFEGTLLSILDSDIVVPDVPVIPDEPVVEPETVYMSAVMANPISVELEAGQTIVAVSSNVNISSNVIAPISSPGAYKLKILNGAGTIIKNIILTITDPRADFAHTAIHKVEDIYATVQPDERIVFISRHAARGSDTSVYGDLSSTGISQCKTLGGKLKNSNIDLTKSYIAGSKKYRAKNTAYQVTKAMGISYPSDYDYLADTEGYEWLMERDFFTDADGGSSGVSLDLNAYYCYINEDAYTGIYVDNKTVEKEGVEGDHLHHVNKLENHVDSKSQIIITNAVNLATSHNADISWFGTHDKVICPLTAYVTNRQNPLYISSSDKTSYVKMSTTAAGTPTTGTWSIPLLGGIAIIINKTSGRYETYAFDSGF